MVAIHILHKLVLSARAPIHEDGIMTLCVLVFDFSGEPVNCLEEMVCGVPYNSGTEFVVGRSASGAVGA